TAAAWRCTRPPRRSGCSPAWTPTSAGCGSTSRSWCAARPEREDTVLPERRPRHSIATVCLSGTLEDKVAAAAAAGFDGIEVFEPDLIASPWTPAELAIR